MQRPPRRKTQPLVDGKLLRRAFLWLGLIEAGLCFAAFYLINNWIDIPMFRSWHAMIFSTIPHSAQHDLAITVYYAGVVMAQVGNAFACRTERNRGRFVGWLSNPSLLAGIAIDLLILLGLIYFKPLAALFNHIALPAPLWIGLITFPVIIYSLDWIRKMAIRLRERFIHQEIISSASKEEV